MVDESRIGMYEYVEGLMKSVTENVYLMDEPQELTESDTKDGFIIIEIGGLYDESEFVRETYGRSRVYVTAYIPTMSRGRVNKKLYKQFEDGINEAVHNASVNDTQSTYWIEEDDMLSIDDFVNTNANNTYHVFVKSFVLVVGE